MWAWYPCTVVVSAKRARTTNSDLILSAWSFCFMNSFTIGKPTWFGRPRASSAAISVNHGRDDAGCAHRCDVSGVTFVGAFAGPRSIKAARSLVSTPASMAAGVDARNELTKPQQSIAARIGLDHAWVG